jgi:hypothetical protein
MQDSQQTTSALYSCRPHGFIHLHPSLLSTAFYTTLPLFINIETTASHWKHGEFCLTLENQRRDPSAARDHVQGYKHPRKRDRFITMLPAPKGARCHRTLSPPYLYLPLITPFLRYSSTIYLHMYLSAP